MLRFSDFVSTQTNKESPSVNFLMHLMSPVGTHHADYAAMHIAEVTVFSGFKNLAHKNFERSESLVQQGNDELPSGNLHKRIHAGFASAYRDMANEDPKTRRAKLRASRAVLNGFAQSRGFKKMPRLLRENGKLEKSTGERVWAKGLALAPHGTNGLSGFDVCPKASSECRANCLGTEAGGNRLFGDSALASKILKTHAMAMHPEHFARVLDHEIGTHTNAATKKGYKPGIRLNVTSDLPFEHYSKEIFNRHPNTEFYDYTKLPARVLKQDSPEHPRNYRLALSHTGADHEESNDAHAAKVLEAGHIVAMVFQKGKGKKAPTPTHVLDVKSGKSYPIVDGDKDDHLPSRHDQAGLKPGKRGHGVVSGLKLKGVTNDSAGAFANKVDPDGIIRINRG